MFSSIAVLLWLAALSVSPVSPAPSAPIPGKLHPAVTCQASPGHSYALYLPKAYREDRLWPVIFVFSPSGDGAEAAALFQGGAERLGWIVIASNDARNGPWEPIRAAQAALWREAFEHTRADPKRVYAAGFSGGARAAMDLAENHGGGFLGLISIGAFGTSRALGPGRLAHVLLCGEEDFNHAELAAVWERLRGSRGRLLWMEHFPGGHRWAPEDLIEEGMVFLDLAAGMQERRARDTVGEAAFLQRRLAVAEATNGELNIDKAQTCRRWRDVAALPGAPAHAEQRAQALAKDPEVRSALSLERSFDERSRRLQTDSAYGTELWRVLGVAGGKGPESLDARRLLERERGMLEERCAEALESRAWERGLNLARALVVIGDRRSRGGVYAAMALAMLGRKDEALSELQGAFARGYHPSRPLEDMPLLAPLREEPAFKALQGPQG